MSDIYNDDPVDNQPTSPRHTPRQRTQRVDDDTVQPGAAEPVDDRTASDRDGDGDHDAADHEHDGPAVDTSQAVGPTDDPAQPGGFRGRRT